MYTASGVRKYYFRGGPLGDMGVTITEEAFLCTRLPVGELILECLREQVPNLCNVHTILHRFQNIPEHYVEYIVLETELKKYVYEEEVADIEEGEQIFRFTGEIVRSNTTDALSIGTRVLSRTELRNAVAHILSLKEEGPTTHCFECGKNVPIEETYHKKNDPNYALCESCFKRAEQAGRAKLAPLQRA